MIGYIAGLLSGLILGVGIFSKLIHTAYHEECEKDLPHAQKCILTAVPKEEEL